ncbi:HIT family protein [Actinomadura darangshiensis]|uniref:HIT family protein n=1 Tax=Actinomadura darangshiensis TaxID=705336 RepID=UPI001A9E26A4|nr:HIT family protein [Actinomadura darangshiensis]
MKDECPFCMIGSGETDDDLVAFRTDRVFVSTALKQRSANPGQVLVCPVAHVTALHAAEPPLLTELLEVVTRVTRAAPAAFGAMGTTVMNNNNAPDQVISHLHVHVIPRFDGDDLVIPNPDRRPAPRNVRVQLTARLRDRLAEP